jgi:cysteinyl-tRNA synthetase
MATPARTNQPGSPEPHESRALTLRLRDTLTRSVRPVEPIEPGRVRMYTCGPTVYRYAHVGNLRSYLLADLIRRVLLYHGLEVFHVKNITDVGHLRDERFDRGEDRMLVQAGLEDRTPAEIAAAYEAAFHADEALVHILPAHVFPRATEHVPEMIALAERLQDLGYAYASPEGNLYYEVARFPGYGHLSGNSLDELRAGHRGDVEPDKRDSADFALWKAAGEGRILRWPTPRWGDGFPGWHLECSAMAMRYLGDRFDIHTGGIDNVFPHHEDEIAQSAPIVGGVPANHWVHGEFLLMSGRKMAKSAGNFQRVTELAERGIDPLALRYLAMTSRYAHKLDYSDASIGGAAKALESLRSRLRALGPAPIDGPWSAPPVLRAGWAGDRPQGVASGVAGHGADPGGAAAAETRRDRAHHPDAPLSDAGRAVHDRFVEALDDDLDLPGALGVVREVLRAPISPDERRWLVLDADAVLGLGLDQVWDAADADADEAVPHAVSELVAARTAARAARDYATADDLRARIEDAGWAVTDGPDGPVVSRR